MSVTSKTKLIAKLRDKEYRDAYVEEKVSTSLPFQIRALREQPERQWSQAELGKRAGMRQNAISRLEDAESGTPSISTLLRLAHAFDVALLIKFVPFRKLLSEFADLSTEALQVNSFDKDVDALAEEAATVTATYSVPVSSATQSTHLLMHEIAHHSVPWAPTRFATANIKDLLDSLKNLQVAAIGLGTTDLVSIDEVSDQSAPSSFVFKKKSAAPLATELVQ
jgi:transcriptional regulator with XRE-family HTH domain